MFDRVRPRGGTKDVVDDIAAPTVPTIPECLPGVGGKSVKLGDLIGCGEVDLRGLV